MADRSGVRTVLVPAERLSGWVERFGERHGEPEPVRDGLRVRLHAPDGATAEYDSGPPLDRFGIVLVRRGGYAVGVVEDAELVAHKTGTRYVQGQTKAGGWSQQRYARRRANQADELATACASQADRLFGARRRLPVFGGGDRPLVASVLAAMTVTVELQDRWLTVPDPRHQVLVDAVGVARSYEIRLNARA